MFDRALGVVERQILGRENRSANLDGVGYQTRVQE